MNLNRLQDKLGYHFRDSSHLDLALTHRSRGMPNNERLEFLGDSVLGLVVSTLLYRQFAKLPEGDMSRLRAWLVKEDTLSTLANQLDLGNYMQLGEGELKSGGFRRPSILADALEAVFGAIYLDGGLEAVKPVVEQLYEPLVLTLDPKTIGKDPKTLLQEYLQGRKMPLPLYSVLAVTGEAHDQHFRVECHIPALDIRTHGEGASRRRAEQEAARLAYEAASKA